MSCVWGNTTCSRGSSLPTGRSFQEEPCDSEEQHRVPWTVWGLALCCPGVPLLSQTPQHCLSTRYCGFLAEGQTNTINLHDKLLTDGNTFRKELFFLICRKVLQRLAVGFPASCHVLFLRNVCGYGKGGLRPAYRGLGDNWGPSSAKSAWRVGL